MTVWPDWWQFELVHSPHLIERMEDRGFTETDLRAMLDDADEWREATMPSRYILSTAFESADWEAIVELDELHRQLIIVTAYRVESSQ